MLIPFTTLGYHIRFDKDKNKHTKVLFVTEGLLLRQMITDPLLTAYNVIILDEIHERHTSCDFLIGAIKCLLSRRNDLKVILMSATINCDLFSSYFDQCPVVKVPGRLYPIEVEYYPMNKNNHSKMFSLLKNNPDPHQVTSQRIDPKPYLEILQRIDAIYPS